MSDRPREILVADPDLPWDGPFPYALLDAALRDAGHAGLPPSATAAEVKDALFDLMAAGRPDQALHAAWNELRLGERRVVVDFFLHRLACARIDPDDDRLFGADLPVRALPLAPLLDVGVDVERLADVLVADPGPAPDVPVPLDLAPPDPGPIDLSAEDVAALTEALDA